MSSRVLKIRLYPDEILRKKSLLIKEVDSSLSQLVRDMEATLLANDGIGLAANQVGVLKSCFILNLSNEKNKPEIITILNPALVETRGEIEEVEGCLSLPGIREVILRPKSVIIKGLSLEGKEIILEFKNLLARAAIHEYEHLQGILIIDHLDALRKKFIEPQLKAIAKLKETSC